MFEQSGYRGFRQVVLFGGVAMLIVMAILMRARGGEGVEVFAVLLYIPILLALLRFDVRGGSVAALLAFLLYVLARHSAISIVGSRHMIGLLGGHAVAYLAFGLAGGLGNSVLREAVGSVDPNSTIDTATGLYSALFFMQSTASELARAERYDSLFSVATLSISAAAVESLGKSQKALLLAELGKMLRGGVRTVDRVVIAHDAAQYRVAAILPETGAEGAKVFAGRLADRLAVFLLGYGVAVPPRSAVTFTVPGDEEEMERLRQEFSTLI